MNVCAAFLRPKAIHSNLNRPNGVVTAVLGTSLGATGIWWYAHTTSSLEKMVAPCNDKECHGCGGPGSNLEQYTS